MRKIFSNLSLSWRYALFLIVGIDLLLLLGGAIYALVAMQAWHQAATAAAMASLPTPTLIPSPTATPWAGPGPTATATPMGRPSPTPTEVLAESGFAPGFTPTPAPTREAINIKLPYVYPAGRSRSDLPSINQIHYPEPFFPPGTNNACGPVALYAAMQGLNTNISYGHLRNIAVNHGFTSYGISKSGIINTAVTLNQQYLNNSLSIEHGKKYNMQGLLSELKKGGVIMVLLQVKKERGNFRVTSDYNGSFGHFILVERVSFRQKKVWFAGSTLGMDSVPLNDFIEAWSGQRQDVGTLARWRSFLKKEPANRWAFVIKKSAR